MFYKICILLLLASYSVSGLAQTIQKSNPKTKKPTLPNRGTIKVTGKVRGLSLAQSIAVKSLSVQNEKNQALLAKEAHDLNVISGGNPNDPYIYDALYKAIDKLNPNFNKLKKLPKNLKSCPKDSVPLCIKQLGIFEKNNLKNFISKNTNTLYSVHSKGVIRVWEMEMYKYADQICEKVQGNLSDKSWEKYIGTDDPSGRTMYIKTPDGGRRMPVSTCSPKYQPILDGE